MHSHLTLWMGEYVCNACVLSCGACIPMDILFIFAAIIFLDNLNLIIFFNDIRIFFKGLSANNFCHG